MNFEQRLDLIRDLIARRDEIDAQIGALFEGRPAANRGKRKCSHCGETGHRSDSCPQREGETAETITDESTANDGTV